MIKKATLLFLIIIGGTFAVHSQADYKLAEQDSLALVAFYWATDGPNWTSNVPGFGFDDLSVEWQDKYDGKYNNWFDGPVKDWFGIKVAKRPIENSIDSIYRVTWIWPVIGRRTDGQNKLKGYVPREIGLLTALEHFRVNGNDGFRDELIPDEIYHKSLEHFDTEAAWFGGGLSDALRNSTSIRKLNVRYNNYDFMPNLDFLDEEGLRNLEGTQWFYNSRFSYFYMERIVDYFYSISPTPKEFGFEARDMFDVGDEMEIVAPLGTSVEMICNDAGMREEDITYQWFKDGLSKFGKTKKAYSISSISASDYGHYKTRINNEYVKAYDQNGNYGEVFTKGIHIVPEPVVPVIGKAVVSNNGQYIDLYFSKPMTNAEGFNAMNISSGENSVEVIYAEVRGRINKEVRIHLSQALNTGEIAKLSYSSGLIKDANGGILQPLDGFQVENRTRIAPMIIGASTTLDGSGIVLDFNNYIDESSLASSLFSIEADNEYTISSLSLLPGPIDAKISKSILITLNEAVSDSAEDISLKYISGGLFGLFSGSVTPSDDILVDNNVTVDRTNVLLQFEDGSEALENVLIKGSWKIDPLPLYDDGTHGDLEAGDHTWSYIATLANEVYKWDVLNREIINATDTITSVDTLGNTVLTLVETTINKDSILNGDYLLQFLVGDREVTGDTIYGIFNRDVVFNLQVNADGEDIFLMGIDDEWNDGIIMENLGENQYSYTLPKKTAGNLISYNYRKGESFENETPETRVYTVVNGENIINDQFGIFTDVADIEQRLFLAYPNPSSYGFIKLIGVEQFERIHIYNASGQLRSSVHTQKQDFIYLDISNEPKGMYYITGMSEKGDPLQTIKIIKH